jgi:putative oxidoreductase
MTTQVLQRLVKTDGERTQAFLRVVLGVVMLPHGLQKLFGWFGGYGFENTMGYLTEGMGLPWVLALLVILAESLGALALIAGAGGRLAALGIAAVMVGAVLTSHLSYGFFMNWGGGQAGEGFEYHLLALALAGGVVVRGSGAWSVDRWLARRWLEPRVRAAAPRAVTA